MNSGQGERSRFDWRLLDPQDPFEIDDGNRPHLYKHLPNDSHGKPVPVGPEDILDVYLDGYPAYFEADDSGWADWLMVGMVPALIVCVPLAPPKHGDVSVCRPIGIYKVSEENRIRYLRGDTDD